MAYVVEKRGIFYAVIYEGTNPVSGRERRRWHRCEDRPDAEQLARTLGQQRDRYHRAGSSITLREYLIASGSLRRKGRSLQPLMPAT